MKISVTDIIQIQGAVKKVSIIERQVDTTGIIPPINLAGPIHLEGDLEVNSNKVNFKGTLKTEVRLPCDRCMSDLIYHIESEVTESFGQTHPEDEEESKPIEQSTIDLTPTVVETILLSLPMKAICSENCKGMCTVCGQNFNEKSCDCDLDYTDPRLEKFKFLFKDNNEDKSNKEV